MKWSYEMHLPHGSADGNWQVIDAESDNGDVVATVDPLNICESLDRDPEDYALLIAAAPELLEALWFVRDAENRLRNAEAVTRGDVEMLAEELEDMCNVVCAAIAKATGN